MRAEWRPCCGSCGSEALNHRSSPVVCARCGVAWDGSELPDDERCEAATRAVFLRTSVGGKMTVRFEP